MSAFDFGFGLPGGGTASFGINKSGSGKREIRSHRYARESAYIDRANTYDQAFENIDRFRGANLEWDQQYSDMDVKAAKQKQINEIAAMRESGLHPAFSAGIGGSSPANYVGGAPAVSGGVTGYGAGGSSRGGGSASFKMVNKSTAEFNAANTELIRARSDLVREQIEDIRAARGGQNQSGQATGAVEIVPDTVISADPHDRSETAGKNKPVWNSFKVGSGSGETITAPVSEADQLWESPTVWAPVLTVKKNRQALQNILDRKSLQALRQHPAYKFFKWAKKKLNIGNARTYPLINEDSP